MKRQPPEGATLDARTLNRTLLARQLLLERAGAEPVDVVERLVGMQAQVPLDPYVGLWSRLRSFDPDSLGRALLERRCVRMTLMRATLHLASSADALRIRPLLQGMLERAFGSSPFRRALGDLDLEPVVARGRALVDERPLTLAQLRTELAAEWPERDPNALAYAVRYLLPLVQVTPRGVWGRTLQPTVTTLDAWLANGPPVAAASVDDLVLRYLRAFGPASTADVAAWSGLADLRTAVARLRPRLRVYRDAAGRELLDVADGIFADAAEPAPARFLPQYDNVFLAHADRGRIMDAVRWDSSFAHRGTLLVDGFVAGAWKLAKEKRGATLSVDLRTRVSATERRELATEAEALLAFLAPDARSRRVRLEA
ncbi:MAG TPA: winged helix DNA-binding domain-containing protein [Gaiellaceae bacterium]|nr:winged helix DNA-binding domain-containing protein [Gaiellaceae bacterium]